MQLPNSSPQRRLPKLNPSPPLLAGGGPYREGVTAYDGSADSWGRARFFYANLADGNNFCTKVVPDTASATPLMFNDVWIVCDCANNILGFPNMDKSSSTGGMISPLWKWSPPDHFTKFPALATPVISVGQGVMFVLYKDTADPRLFSLRLNNFGQSLPTLIWNLDLATVSTGDGRAVFNTFQQDHAILYYGRKVWVPSNDFDGALIVDSVTGTYITTTGLSWDSQRLMGSVGGQDNYWQSPVFVTAGSFYGIQSFNGNTGSRAWWSNNSFAAYTNEFTHPVAVTFLGEFGTVNCIIASQWDRTGDIFISGANANNDRPCGYWNPNGYTIRRPALAMPTWVSTPAVLYDGSQIVYLVYAVMLPSGDPTTPGRRTSWRSSLVSIQIDITGPYSDPAESFILEGARLNAAPIIVRDAWGMGYHAIAAGDSSGRLHIFPAKGYSNTGPVFSHDLTSILPLPNNPSYPGVTNLRTGISGNYMAASRGGSVGFIMHNEDAETNWFGVVAGAMFPLPTDVTPSPSPRAYYPSISAAPAAAAPAPYTAAVDTTAAVFGSLGGIVLACGAIVLFFPRSGFMLGAKLIIPADIIKDTAGSVLGGVKSMAGALAPKGGAAMGGGVGAAAPFVSSGSSGERKSLLG